jgi:hypothetical protein
MKNISLLLIGLLLAGCSKNHFSPEMKGIGFWESPEIVQAELAKGGAELNSNCFSLFAVKNLHEDWSKHQLHLQQGAGIPIAMGDRTKQGYKTVLAKADITSVSWNKIDSNNAGGAFRFDAFFGNGYVMFRASKINGEWVINWLAIPHNDEGQPPLIVFDLKIEELEKYIK